MLGGLVKWRQLYSDVSQVFYSSVQSFQRKAGMPRRGVINSCAACEYYYSSRIDQILLDQLGLLSTYIKIPPGPRIRVGLAKHRFRWSKTSSIISAGPLHFWLRDCQITAFSLFTRV